MNCRQTAENLDLFRENALDGTSEEAMMDHMGSCPACRALLAQADALDRDLKSALQEQPASPAFTTAVVSRLDDQPETSRTITHIAWLRPVLVAAACLMLALCAWIYYPKFKDNAPTSVAATISKYDFVEPAATEKYAIGKPFVIGEDGVEPYDEPSRIEVVRIVKGVPEMIVEAFPES